MPIYQFECDKCRAAVVRHQTTYEVPTVPCEACGTLMRLVILATDVVYKGDGWAKKDRAKGGE